MVAVDYLIERIDRWPAATRRALRSWSGHHDGATPLPSGIERLELNYDAAPLLTTANIEAAAPDDRVVKAARSLAKVDKWLRFGQNDTCSWGVVRGSSDVYNVYVQLQPLQLDCSCPSRKRPCKHAIALLLCPLRSIEVPEADPPAGHREASYFYDSSWE